ncbi:MAG TPA: hypothetical protein DDY68_05010, partial [Porphyromonadaceae bacterium]|nr:hypothetical protein [Porphyromonadaceae bacterium]
SIFPEIILYLKGEYDLFQAIKNTPLVYNLCRLLCSLTNRERNNFPLKGNNNYLRRKQYKKY